MTSIEFNRDFQRRLLIHMVKDVNFFEQVNGSVHLTDFGLPACRLMLEVVRNYYYTYKRLPVFKTIESLILFGLSDASGLFETKLTPTDHESLADLMRQLAMTRDCDLDSAYFADKLQDFLAHVRLSAISPDNVPAREYLKAVIEIEEGLKNVSTSNYDLSDASDPLPAHTTSCGERIGIGVAKIDRMLAGGLCRGQFGLNVACTGVGKTTTMINTCQRATLLGWHCLFITLELTKTRIIERYQMMGAMIEAGLFASARITWPDQKQKQYEFFTSKEVRARMGSMTVAEKIGNCRPEDVNHMIDAWKKKIKREYGTDERCALVCVDWLDLLEMTHMRKDASDERKFFYASESLRDIAKRQFVVLWTATQGAKQAINKEKLTLSDVQWGYSKSHLTDATIGFAVQAAQDPVTGDIADDTFDSNVATEDTSLMGNVTSMPPCDRTLVVSIMKERDASTAGKTRAVYQGPTLGLWDSKEKAQTALLEASKPDMSGLRRLLMLDGANGIKQNAELNTVGELSAA